MQCLCWITKIEEFRICLHSFYFYARSALEIPQEWTFFVKNSCLAKLTASLYQRQHLQEYRVDIMLIKLQLNFEFRLEHKEPVVQAHLLSSRHLAKSPGCAQSLQRPSPSPGCRTNWITSYWRTAMSCTRSWFILPLRFSLTSTRVSTQSSTRSCGDLFASHSSR